MSSRDIAADQKNEQLLMTEKRKYPQVFKWKIAVIVIVVLIAIVLVVNLIMFFYLKNHQLRNNNYTFASQMVTLLSKTSMTKDQFVNLIRGLTKSYTDIWFQNATQIASWNAQSGVLLTMEQAAKFFETKVENRITLIYFNDGTKNFIIGAYTHIPFQLPADTWKDYLANASNYYYNFQIDEKESTLFGSNSETYLKMNGTADNLANCRLIEFNKASLKFILGVNIRLSSTAAPAQAQISFPDSAKIEKTCLSTPNYDNDMTDAVGGISFNTYYNLTRIITFSLKT